MKTHNQQSLFLKFITIVLLFSFNLFASELVHDDFNNNNDNGYSRDDGWNNQLKVEGKRKSYKIYDFGSNYSNVTLTLTFKLKWRGDWESSGWGKDYFKLNLNDEEVVNDTFSGDADSWKAYTLSTTADSDGKLKVEFFADTTKKGEYIAIDDVIISGTALSSDADLLLENLSYNPQPAIINNDINYTMNLKNSGGVATTNSLKLQTSDGLFKSLSGDGWSCSGVNTDTATCTKESIQHNENDTLEFIFQAPSQTGTVTLNATVSSTTTDSDNSNNSTTINVDVKKLAQASENMCYGEKIGGCAMFVVACDTSYPINNIGDNDITDTKVFLDTTGFGAFMSSCNVDGGEDNENCSNQSNYEFGPASIFPKGTEYDLGDSLTSDNPNHTVGQKALFQLTSLQDFYATYVIGDTLYQGKLPQCGDTTPDLPIDETIPDDSADATQPECDTFADMFQTRGSCSDTSGGKIEITNAGETLDGSSNIILDNSGDTLNTCLLTTTPWVQEQYETCGESGDCQASGSGGKTLSVNYINPPVSTSLEEIVTDNTKDIVLDGTNTYTEHEYDEVTSNNNTNSETTFTVVNQLKINKIALSTDNKLLFSSDNAYSLDIGSVEIESNGARNSFTTDENSKNIKIKDFSLAENTTLSLEATQTIKMETLSIGRGGSDVSLTAQYININDMTFSNSGDGVANIHIKADYIDIGSLNFGQGATLTIEPYTAGKRILFRSNSISASSSSTMVVSSGNYYTTTFDIPGTSDASSIIAASKTDLINLYINGDFEPGNNPAINAPGNNGTDLLSDTLNPASKFLIFINGDLSTGGGGTTFNATIYVEGDLSFGSSTYAKGAISASNISIAAGQFIYDQTITDDGMGECDATPADFTCANPKEFEAIFSQNLYGKLLLIGNTSLCKNDGNNQCMAAGNSRNNDIDMMNNDFDNDSETTVNSSAALLNVPEGKKIVWAGLFWQGYFVTNNGSGGADQYQIPDETKEMGKNIKFKHESDSYQVYTNNKMNWVYFTSSRFYYQGFRDVTEYVQAHNGGYYWVGDLASSEGKPVGGSYGAWSLAVVYEDQDEDFKGITVYRGYKAFANNTDINNAKTYAAAHSCDTSNTGVGNEVTSTLSGFLTPAENEVKAQLVVFAGEGDKGLTGDKGYITDKAGDAHYLSNAVNPETDIMNASISVDGASVTTGKPYYDANSLGIDIDTFDVSGILDNKQTTTDIVFNTNGDGYMPGMYGLETQLYIPKFCYDYAYSQNNVFFTEPNDGTNDPKLTGEVTKDTPIKMAIYIKNEVSSDIAVSDFSVDVFDINTTQVTYHRESTKRTPVNAVNTIDISDADLNVSDSQIEGIYIGDIGSNEYFYFYYDLDAKQNSLDAAINIEANYNLEMAGEIIPYNLKLGAKIDMCTDNNFRYQPAKSIFNIVHNNYYNDEHTYYNLPTQITNREGNFKVLSLKPDDPDTLVSRSTVVAVEIIDASAFHDTNASCQQQSSAVTPRVWVTFDNNVSTTMFDSQVLQLAVNNNMTTLTNPKEFYKNARSNAAFRVTYNAVDTNGSIVQLQNLADEKYQILNYSDLTSGLSVCSNSDHAITDDCKTDGDALSKAELASCMECVYGYRTKFICSRDNFSIRPEAFLIKINDKNQTDGSNVTRLADMISGVTAPLTEIVHLAAGYDYNIEINATNHDNNDASSGYTKTFNSSSVLDSIKYIWEPRNSKIVSGCNDISDEQYFQRFYNGVVNSNLALDQIGEYRLSAQDSAWSGVDHISVYMTHHTGEHFAPGTDCVEDSSASYPINDSHLNGCNISSNHINSDAVDSSGNKITLYYNDYNITLHPYQFDIKDSKMSVNLSYQQLTPSSYVYMANIVDDENQSTHINGKIKAEGYNGERVSNFVSNCFATPLDIAINRSQYSDSNNKHTFQARLHAYNNAGTHLYSINKDLNNTLSPLPLATTSFSKESNGTTTVAIHLNFKRENDKAMNPQVLQYNDYSISCANPSECTLKADLGDRVINSSLIINQPIKYYYARTNAPRYSFEGSSGDAFIYYEIHCNGTDSSGTTCDKTLLPNGLDSNATTDPRWFINMSHIVANDGTVGTVSRKAGVGIITASAPSGETPDKVSLTYDESKGYPYKTTMKNSASPWLIYNKYNATATENEFDVEFIRDSSSWAGKDEAQSSTTTEGSSKTNRRSMW